MYHFSTTQNMTSSVQKYASTFQTGANRWKPQVADWPCSCTAVLDITPSGTKWQCSGDTDGTSEAWDRWQAQTLQTEPCCSLWPGRAWELNADSPHGPGPHTTQHQDYCRHSHCEPQMPLMVILVMSELSTVARSKKKSILFQIASTSAMKPYQKFIVKTHSQERSNPQINLCPSCLISPYNWQHF